MDNDANEFPGSQGSANSGGVDVDWIISELDRLPGKLPVDALRAAQRHPEMVTPRLLQVFRDAIALVRDGKMPEGHAPFFTWFLLAEFQVKEFLPLIIEVLSLPESRAEDFLGDASFDLPARFMAALADDPVKLFDELLGDASLPVYLRSEVAQGFQYLVRDGVLTREDAIEHLRQPLRESVQNRDPQLVSHIVLTLHGLAPQEIYDDIVEAYRNDVVEMLGLKDIDESIADPEKTLEQTFRHLKPTGVPDTVEELRSWPYFDIEPAPRPHRSTPVWTPPSPSAARPKLRQPRSFDLGEPLKPAAGARVGRNDPCPCGSGKKHKKCCGAGR